MFSDTVNILDFPRIFQYFLISFFIIFNCSLTALLVWSSPSQLLLIGCLINTILEHILQCMNVQLSNSLIVWTQNSPEIGLDTSNPQQMPVLMLVVQPKLHNDVSFLGGATIRSLPYELEDKGVNFEFWTEEQGNSVFLSLVCKKKREAKILLFLSCCVCKVTVTLCSSLPHNLLLAAATMALQLVASLDACQCAERIMMNPKLSSLVKWGVCSCRGGGKQIVFRLTKPNHWNNLVFCAKQLEPLDISAFYPLPLRL